MIIKTAEFIKSAVKPSHYPQDNLPEIAFAGRSNVGKSSLINTLVNRKHLVKTSSTPGRTQLINFFQANSKLSLVDLPGYGYAKVPTAVRKEWGPMIENYLSTRPSLRGVVLIMDIRRQPRNEEIDFIKWMERQNLAHILVLTKTDKLSKTKQIKQRNMIAKVLGIEPEGLILFSAKTRKGREDVWANIRTLTGL
jgi:GTP-binding protein